MYGILPRPRHGLVYKWFAEELGFQDICVEGDTLTVVKKLNGEHND
ncbi:hypothetical protein Gotur_023635, partial [Gossypium turneri]